MRVWVNFRELRKKLDFEAVLRKYNVKVVRKGVQHQGPCPLPKHTGSRQSASFSANLERGIFQCFSCGAKGNVLEFAAMMTGVDPADSDGLRSVAVELQQRFFPDGASTRTKRDTGNIPSAPKSVPVVTNAPLNFELKGLDAGHEWFRRHELDSETLEHFGVGFCRRGLLKDRIAIPIHNADGELVGYSGRIIDKALITEGSPRYLLPSRREVGGTVYEFRKELLLYNVHRIESPCEDLIVVQDFAAVLWLHQNDFPQTVALMGDECSQEQTDLIVGAVGPKGRLWVVTDGNEAGDAIGRMVVTRLACHRFVRWVRLGNGQSVLAVPSRELHSRLTQ